MAMPSGPRGSSRGDSGEVLTLAPIGVRGVDLFTDPAALAADVLSRGEDIAFVHSTADRRAGATKIARLSTAGTTGASRTFGTTAKYATFTPPLIPVGGWAINLHFVAQAAEIPAGTTGWIVGARPNGQTYHVFKVTNSDSGGVVVSWRTSAGATHSITLTGISDGLVCHLLVVYDAIAGTFTCYLNGAVSGTPINGLASTLQPAQDAGVVWTFGVEKETGVAVTANSAFPNAIDGLTLFTLRGARPALGTQTVTESLRRHSARAWPTPQHPAVLAHYDMDEASGTVMYDRSGVVPAANGTYVGGPSVTAPVALLSAPTNLVQYVDVPGGAFNVVGNFGNLFYERVSEAVV